MHQLVDKSQSGIINLCSSDCVSKYDFSVALAKAFGFDPEVIQLIQASRQRNIVKRLLDLSPIIQCSRMFWALVIFSTAEAIKSLQDTETLGRSIQNLGRFIPYGLHFIDDPDVAAVAKYPQKWPLTQGPAGPQFEQRIAEYTGQNMLLLFLQQQPGFTLLT